MKNICAIFAGTLFSIGATTSVAAVDVDALQSTYQQGQAASAYEYAVAHRDEGEGDPRFDLYYGMAAIDTGHLNEGVFALERVLLLRPASQRARLELARGYFLLGEDTRARQEFNMVLEQNPSATVQANVQRYLDAIRLREGRFRPSSTAYVEFGLGHDDNVSSATDDSFQLFGSPLFVVNSSKESDQFHYVQVGGTYNRPINPQYTFFADADANSRHNWNDQQFDTGYINGNVGMSYRVSGDEFRFSLQGQKYYLDESSLSDLLDDDETFREMIALNVEWRRQLSQQTRVSAFFQGANLHYPGADIRDSFLTTLGIGATHVVNNDRDWVKRYKPVVFGSLWVGDESADQKSNAAEAVADRELIGMRGGIRILPTPKLALDGSLMYQYSHYNEATGVQLSSSGTPKTRLDDYYGVTVGARYLLTNQLVLGGEATYTRNDSSLALNDFDRSQLRGFVRYSFN